MGSPSSSSPPSTTSSNLDAKPYTYAAARWACFRLAKRRNTSSSTSRHPITSVLLLLLALASTHCRVSAAVIDMDPPPGKTCFGPADLFEIGKTEIFVILNLAQGVTLSDTRRYELCTDTTYPFGLEDPGSGPFHTYDGNTTARLRPLSLVNPNVEVHCGPPPGSSDSGCVFGGPGSGVAVNSPADRRTIVDYVNLLGPTINPAFANIGDSIPQTWRPDTTNLVLRGITFRGSEAVEDDDCSASASASASPTTNPSCIYGPVRLYAYGQNQRVVDCRFEAIGWGRAQYGGIVLSYSQAWHAVDPNRDMTVPYQELIVQDTVFENNKFRQGAIVTRMAIAANAGDPPDGTARKGFKVQILNSKFKSNTIQGPHMLTLWEATGRVERSCFVDNVVDQTVVSDVFGPAASEEEGFDFRAQSPSNTCGACTQGVYSAGEFQGSSADYCPELCECNVDISTRRRTIKSQPAVLQDESTEKCLKVQGRNGLGLGACSAKNTFFATKRGQLKRKGKRPFCITTYLKNGETPAVKLSRCKNKRKKSSSQQYWRHNPNGILQMKKPFKGVKYCLSTTGGDGHAHDDHGDGDGHAHDADPKVLTLVACSGGDVVPWNAGLPVTPSN